MITDPGVPSSAGIFTVFVLSVGPWM